MSEPTPGAPGPRKGFLKATRDAFLHPAGWTMFWFGFSSGLPFLLVATTLALWLKESGIKLADITLIAGANLSYAFKFLWAPLLDHARAPLFARLGRRRGWLLLAQVGLVIGMLAMAGSTPAHLPLFIGATLAVAFFGATNDMAVDAYRIEIAPEATQGALVALYALGYRIGLIIGGALAWVLADHIPWPRIYVLMAAFMLLPILANLRAVEPAYAEPGTRRNWREHLSHSIVDPLVDLFRRYGLATAALLLGFILLFKIPEQATVGGIVGPFYLDMGFSKTEMAAITKVYGVWIGIVGVFFGGILVASLGAWRALGLMAVVCGSCNLLYLLLIAHPGNLAVFTLVISAENLTLGMLNTPTVSFLSSLVNRQHTATQYALLSSLVNLPGKLVGVFAGTIATALGYGGYFVVTVIALAPAMLLYAALWRRFDRAR